MNNSQGSGPLPTTETMRLYADALRSAQNAQALPQSVAKLEADILIKRAHDSAPMFGDIDPPLPAVTEGRDNTTPPPPVPAEPVPRTGLHGRPIITLKKIRRVIK
jgi:hypothetical protein